MVLNVSRTGLGNGLTGQVALVTGGSQGIGRAIAEMLAQAGADIVLNHLGAAPRFLDQVSRSITDAGREILIAEADVARKDEVATMIRGAVGQFGRIDILVNNAGIAPECGLSETSEEIWDRVLAVNLKGQFLVCQAVVPHMLAAGYGRIINIASEQGLIGAAEMSAYCASKAGVFGLTKALARELAPAGILVNCVAPGPVDTALLADRDRTPELLSRIPLGRIGQPDEIAFAVLFLASPRTSWYLRVRCAFRWVACWASKLRSPASMAAPKPRRNGAGCAAASASSRMTSSAIPSRSSAWAETSMLLQYRRHGCSSGISAPRRLPGRVRTASCSRRR
jgi:3-oxoacyl-[acyl-carrier protein] reductase